MAVILFVLALAVFALLIYLVHEQLSRPKNFPPGPISYLPFIGNTPLLRKLAIECGGQHKAFEKLSKENNSPVIGLKLGRELLVVALTYPLVKEVHAREEFEGRPDNFFLRLRTMGTRLGVTCTDGAYWNEQRSFVVRQLRNVGYGKTKMETQIQSELKELLDLIGKSGEPIWPGKTLLPPSVINILWTFTTGQRIERSNPRLINFLKLIQKRSKVFDIAGGTLSQIPWLRFVAPEWSGYTLIKNLNAEFYAFFMEIIEEHLATYNEENEGEDLIYAFIQEMKLQEGNPNTNFTLTQLVMVILDVFIAGSNTTSSTIDIALMITLMRPDIQAKCYQEIHAAFGETEMPNYTERSKTPYVEAMLMEVNRFFEIAPLGGPRRVMKTCELGGYVIPKNTTLLIGLGTVHMDKEYWKDPEIFRPERFLDKNMEIANLERMVHFGSGRRKCLGDQLARACIYSFYVGILQSFMLNAVEAEYPSLKLLPGITQSKPQTVQNQF